VPIVNEFDGFFDIANHAILPHWGHLADRRDSLAEWRKDVSPAEFAGRAGFAGCSDYRGAWR
jgi:hypothetical protein